MQARKGSIICHFKLICNRLGLLMRPVGMKCASNLMARTCDKPSLVAPQSTPESKPNYMDNGMG